MDDTSPSRGGGDSGDRLLALVSAVHRLALAESVREIQEIVREFARHAMGADGATFILREDGDVCFHADEDAITPLWKGQRFEITACISGWAMLRRESVAIPDIYVDERIDLKQYGPTFVKSLLMTPIHVAQPIGAVGLYWANHHIPTDEEISIMRALAHSTAAAMSSEPIELDLAGRTVEPADKKTTIRREVIDLRQGHEDVSELAIADQLTGLYNHRGFTLLAGKALDLAPRTGSSAHFVRVDVDGLDAANDTFGHPHGSAMIVAAATVLRRSFRSADIIARIGGEEFAVFVPGADSPDAIVARIEGQTQFANDHDGLPAHLALSIGVTLPVHRRGATVDMMLAVADAAMHRDRRAKRRGEQAFGGVPSS